jgi:hypothetical protein
LPRVVVAHPLRAIVAFQAVWLWWAYSQGWFLQADLSNLSEAVGSHPGWRYLSGELGGHFAPVARLVYWAFVQLSPLDYGLSVALRVGCQVLSTVLLYRLLTRLVGDRPLVAGIVACYAVNPLLLGGTEMFTPGITIGIGQVFVLLALIAHVIHEETGNVRAAVAAGLSLGFSVLCSEGWVVAFFAFPVLSAVHFYPGTVRHRLMALLRGWRTWALLAAPVVLAGLAVMAYANPVGAATPTLSAAYRLLRNSWLYGLGPSWVGGPMRWYADPTQYVATASPSDLMVILGQIGVAIVVLVGVQRTGRRSLVAWVLPLGVWVLSILLVGYRGYSTLKVLVAVTPRYLAALILFFAIGAALALAPEGVARVTPTDGGASHRAGAPADGATQRLAHQRRLVTTGLVGLVVLASMVSGVRFARIFGGTPAKHYVDNLSASARLAGSNVNIYDTAVPPWLISPVEPRHRVSDLLQLADVPVTVEGASSTPLIATADGHLVASTFVPASAVLPQPPCGSAVHGAGTFTFPLNREVFLAGWYLHLQLFQQAPSTVSVDLLDAQGKVAQPVHGGLLHLAQLGSLNLRLPRFAPAAVRFHSTAPDTALCFTAIQIGAPFPVVKP